MEMPTADGILLGYLVLANILMGLFGWGLYSLMEPSAVTPIQTDGLLTRQVSHFSLKTDPSLEDAERAAIESAREQNIEQGVNPLLAFAAVRPGEAADPARSELINTFATKHKLRKSPRQSRIAVRQHSTRASPSASSERPLWTNTP